MNKVETDVISTLKEVVEMYNIQGILIDTRSILSHINDTYHVTFSSSVDTKVGVSRTGTMQAGRGCFPEDKRLCIQRTGKGDE